MFARVLGAGCGVPSVARFAHAEDSFFGSASLFVSTRSADGGIEAVLVERLTKRHGLHDSGVFRCTECERVRSFGNAILVGVHKQIEVVALGDVIAKLDHLSEFPSGVYVQNFERDAPGVKCLASQVQKHRRVFANRVEHHRVFECGCGLAKNLDRFVFEFFKHVLAVDHWSILGWRPCAIGQAQRQNI